jgi:putative hydrolase of the HAD superfamily
MPKPRRNRRTARLQAARLWLFDLDDTLHHASHAIFPRQYEAMHRVISRELGLSPEQAVKRRRELFLKHGTTGFGLWREHGIPLHSFFDEVQDDPELERLLKHRSADLKALAKLPGRKVLLTNAQPDYTQRVLKALKLPTLFERVVTFGDMKFAKDWRPKPDIRMMRMLCASLHVHPSHCVLVEDTIGHLKAARRLNMRTALVTGYSAWAKKTSGRPSFVCARIRYVSDLLRQA